MHYHFQLQAFPFKLLKQVSSCLWSKTFHWLPVTPRLNLKSFVVSEKLCMQWGHPSVLLSLTSSFVTLSYHLNASGAALLPWTCKCTPALPGTPLLDTFSHLLAIPWWDSPWWCFQISPVSQSPFPAQDPSSCYFLFLSTSVRWLSTPTVNAIWSAAGVVPDTQLALCVALVLTP